MRCREHSPAKDQPRRVDLGYPLSNRSSFGLRTRPRAYEMVEIKTERERQNEWVIQWANHKLSSTIFH